MLASMTSEPGIRKVKRRLAVRAPHPETPEGRLKLLRFYYAQNLERLRAVKERYDPENRLDFEMGIPPGSE